MVSLVVTTVMMAMVPTSSQDSPQLMFPLEDEFTVGHDSIDRQFGMIVAMAVSPEGHVVVLDALNRAVTVFDSVGNEVHHWGRQGDGPGELQSPTSVSVSSDMRVAVSDRNRVHLYQIDGELIETQLVPNSSMVGFDANGEPVVLALDILDMALVIARPDGTRVSSEELPEDFVGPFFGPRMIFATIGSGRAVFGVTAGYRLPVVDLTVGAQVGELARDVPIRRVPGDFEDRLRLYLMNPGSAPVGWSSVLGTRTEGVPRAMVDELEIPGTFRTVIHAFKGPPGETVWVRRGLGVGDDLAPPFDPPDHAPLWDLFDAERLEYSGTAGVPEGFIPYTGDARRLAGVQTNELGVQAVRVLRLQGG